mgnify:CR=1 FL=1
MLERFILLSFVVGILELILSDSGNLGHNHEDANDGQIQKLFTSVLHHNPHKNVYEKEQGWDNCDVRCNVQFF